MGRDIVVKGKGLHQFGVRLRPGGDVPVGFSGRLRGGEEYCYLAKGIDSRNNLTGEVVYNCFYLARRGVRSEVWVIGRLPRPGR